MSCPEGNLHFNMFDSTVCGYFSSLQITAHWQQWSAKYPTSTNEGLWCLQVRLMFLVLNDLLMWHHMFSLEFKFKYLMWLIQWWNPVTSWEQATRKHFACFRKTKCPKPSQNILRSFSEAFNSSWHSGNFFNSYCLELKLCFQMGTSNCGLFM